jgi:hypothetical protein
MTQDIVETSRKTYKGLAGDPPSLKIKLEELESPPLRACFFVGVLSAVRGVRFGGQVIFMLNQELQ